MRFEAHLVALRNFHSDRLVGSLTSCPDAAPEIIQRMHALHAAMRLPQAAAPLLTILAGRPGAERFLKFLASDATPGGFDSSLTPPGEFSP